MRRVRGFTCFALALCGGIGCTTGTKQKAAETALTAMDQRRREDHFEATARVLDAHPEMVDEFYAVARRHPSMLQRFMTNTARDLKEKPMATMNGEELVKNPESLEQVLFTTTEQASPNREARAAIDRAMARGAERSVDIVTDDPTTLSRMLEASLTILPKKPAARRAVLVAVRKNRAHILELMKQDKELVKEVGEELVRELVKDKPSAEKVLRAASIIDDKKDERKDEKKDEKKRD